MDTTNIFMVGTIEHDKIKINLAPLGHIGKDDALNLAAWLVALADDSCGEPEGRFHKLLDAILNE